MSEATTAAPGADHPFEKRTCSKCAAEKVVTPQTWPHRKGRTGTYQPNGTRCMECEKARKAKYESVRNDITKRLGAPPASETEKATGKRKEKLDVAAALKAGGITLNQVAPAVMARMLTYIEDEDHEHHQWALEFFAQRIMPRKLYEELGGEAAGVGALQDKRPQFVVNILPAQPGGAPGEVYEHETQALPAPVAPEES